MLQFRIQSTPNPNARKYIVSEDLKSEGRVSYTSPEECAHVPLAKELMEIDGVSQTHFFENVLTVTQTGALDWGQLDQVVQEIVQEHYGQHDTGFIDSLEKPKEKKQLPPELQKIDEILDLTIRPSLQMDGGDVEVLDMEDNILTIRYQGACGGCPSSMTGTLEAIRMILRDEVRDDMEVVAI